MVRGKSTPAPLLGQEKPIRGKDKLQPLLRQKEIPSLRENQYFILLLLEYRQMECSADILESKLKIWRTEQISSS
jgi:hypothetical protein